MIINSFISLFIESTNVYYKCLVVLRLYAKDSVWKWQTDQSETALVNLAREGNEERRRDLTNKHINVYIMCSVNVPPKKI